MYSDIATPSADCTATPEPAASSSLLDRHGRRISYLRLSVTDRCDLRCHYCMPVNTTFLPRRDILTFAEYTAIAKTFVALGVDKIRITGGEPLVRKDVVALCEEIAAIEQLRELVMTTNGTQLARYAEALHRAGVARLNISLDTLDSEKYRMITHNGDIRQVRQGIDRAASLSFRNIRINTVLIRGVNDTELPRLVRYAMARGVDIAFIEEMPLGDVGYRRADTYFSTTDAMAVLSRQMPLTPSAHHSGGPARYYTTQESPIRIGFISPHSNNFCASCNRVRITCTGQLHPCLGHEDAIDLRAVLRAATSPASARQDLEEHIRRCLQIKPLAHDFDIFDEETKVIRFMSRTGG